MSINSGVASGQTARAKRRRMVRYFTAAMAGLTAVMYFLIGFQVVSVVENTGEQAAFGIPAGLAYALAALLLVVFDRRVLWVLGAILQVFIIYTYFDLAPDRTPSYEVWGILIRVAQTAILGGLAYLIVGPTVRTATSADKVGAGAPDRRRTQTR